MAQCEKCGTICENGAKFCNSCGAALPGEDTRQEQAEFTAEPQTTQEQEEPRQGEFYYQYSEPGAQADEQQQERQTNWFENLKDKFFNPRDLTDQYDPQDIEKSKGIAGITYLVFFLPFLAAKDSAFARFHANQGLLLLIAYVLWQQIDWILGYIPFVGGLVFFVGRVIIIIAGLMALVSAFNGKARQLPFIGHFTLIK